MHPGLRSALAPFLLATVAPSQGQVGLSIVSGPRISAAFSNARLAPLHEITQVSMTPHPNGTPGLFLGGLSCQGVPLNLGGRGGVDVVAFTYDRTTDTVTANINAEFFNASGDDYALTWGVDGTYACAQRLHGVSAGVYQSMAMGVGGKLSSSIRLIGGVGNDGTHVLASQIGGANVLFYTTLSGGIAWRTHDVVNAMLTGQIFQVTPHTSTTLMHSPFPMLGADGDAEALLACEANPTTPGGSEWHWQGDLDPSTAPIVQQPTANAYENNGCEAGGRIYMPRFVTDYQVLEFDVVGLLGDSVKTTGGSCELTAFAPTKTSGTPDVTIFIHSPAFLATPQVIPGIANAFGLDPAPGLLVLGAAAHSNATGRAVLTLPMPPLGVGTIPVQGLTVLGSGAAHFTSTAVITITQ
jgi:hypothetical protein